MTIHSNTCGEGVTHTCTSCGDKQGVCGIEDGQCWFSDGETTDCEGCNRSDYLRLAERDDWLDLEP